MARQDANYEFSTGRGNIERVRRAFKWLTGGAKTDPVADGLLLLDPVTGDPLPTPSSSPTVLLTSASATGAAATWAGGLATWEVWGTWSGTTAQLQRSPDGGTTWINIDGASLTANGGWSNLSLPAGSYRVTITGGPGGVSLSSQLSRS
jgi:hypothetical protein